MNSFLELRDGWTDEQTIFNAYSINVRKHFFSERIIKVWNSLPPTAPSIVSFKSLLSFRNSLGNVNVGLYTKY